MRKSWHNVLFKPVETNQQSDHVRQWAKQLLMYFDVDEYYNVYFVNRIGNGVIIYYVI